MNGRKITNTITESVANSRYFPGLLLKKGLEVRTTRTMSAAETTDSISQPVLNRSVSACNRNKRMANVR